MLGRILHVLKAPHAITGKNVLAMYQVTGTAASLTMGCCVTTCPESPISLHTQAALGKTGSWASRCRCS